MDDSLDTIIQENGFTPEGVLPIGETASRQARCLAMLAAEQPEADGMLISGRIGIYYLTGTAASGLLWLPKGSKPVLMVRRGAVRARLESDILQIMPFKSFRDVPQICAEAGSPLGTLVATDKASYSWQTMEMLTRRLPEISFTSCDSILAKARSVKSDYELFWMNFSGLVHAKVLDEILPALIQPGQTEWEIAQLFVQETMKLGSDGLVRTNAHGEELFFGCTSAGMSGCYPNYFNGPLGLRGTHPAVPFMGSREATWERESLLALDMASQCGGYITDRTQVYWSGPRESIPEPVLDAHAICQEIMAEAKAMLKPGITPAEIWARALAIAKRENIEDRFMGYTDPVPFLGHGIGLCVDEWPAIARTFRDPLVPNMCLALEPKIAVPPYGMVGIEHTFCVTEQEPRPITGTEMDIICID